MKKAKKIVSMFVAATFLLSSTVMAIPNNSVVMGNKAFSIDAIFAGVDGIQEALDGAGGKLYYSLEGVTDDFVGLFSGQPMTEEQKAELTNIQYVNADGSIDVYANFCDEEPIQDEELTVESVSALNSTTIQVTFSNGETQTFSGFQLVVGENEVEFEYEGQTFTGVNVTYQPSEAAVESIEFVNYRNIRVTFSDTVDKESAADPANYYMEIVDGNAAYGAMPTLQNSNQLSKIQTDYVHGTDGWWNGVEEDGEVIAEPHIIAQDVNGKTVVDIYLPEDARFTNVKDNASGTYPDSYQDEDAERTLAVKLRTSKTDGVIKKALIKDTSVNVAVRNVKDAEGKLSIDTAVMPIRILDEVKPTLVEAKKVEAEQVENDNNHTTFSSLGKDLGSFSLLRTNEHTGQTGELLQFVYSEPVFDAHDLDKSDLEYYRDVKLYVNGKFIASRSERNLNQFMTFAMDTDAAYKDSKTVTLDVEKAVKEAYREEFATGIDYTVRFVGVTDLAGNIEESSEHSFKVKFRDATVVPPVIVKPEVKNIVQVADNVFRVEFNRAGVKGTLVIENPDGEGFGVFETYIPESIESENGCYYSYVAVPARDHEPNESVPTGINQNQILAYDGQDTIYRTIRVNEIYVENDEVSADSLVGDDYIKNNMKLVNDIKAPVAVTPDEIEYDERSSCIEIAVKDITPWVDDENIDYWVSPIAYKYDDDTKRFRNEIRANQKYADTYLPVKVSYIDADGAVHQAMVSNYDLRPDSGESSDLNPGYEDSITYDFENDILKLDLTNYPQLLGKKGKLAAGSAYKVEIPAGYFTDSPKDTDFWNNGRDLYFGGNCYDLLYVDDGRDDDNYWWWFHTDAGLGYTSTKQVVNVDVEEKPATVPDPEYVPQTSKQLINYDEPTNSMRIEFTGTIDVATLKDKDNYTLDGRTIAEWDNQLGTNTVINYVVDNSNPDNVRQYAVFEIPQDSIQEFGDYSFKVQGVSHPNGGTMTPVETVVRLHDNYRPVVVDAVVTGDRQIKLTFNEPIQYHVDPEVDADPHSTANNFLVEIGGVKYTVDTAVLPVVSDNDREIILNLGNVIPETGSITVEIVDDQNGNILVIDLSTNKNPMKKDVYDVDRAE